MKGIYKVRLADGTFEKIDLRTSIEQVTGLTEKLAEKYNTLTAVEELNNRYTKNESNEKFAPIKSPSLTGEPKAPTAITNDNSKKIATTEYVQKNKALLETDINKKNNIVEFNEEKNRVNRTFAPIESPMFTGQPSGPTPSGSDNSTRFATTAFVKQFIYPIGAIYISVKNTNPSTLFGGMWETLPAGKMLLAQGSGYEAGVTGGEETHKLTVSEMPSHTHEIFKPNLNNEALELFPTVQNDIGNYGGGTIDDEADTTNSFDTGGNQAHNNMPPYLSVYMWKRIS